MWGPVTGRGLNQRAAGSHSRSAKECKLERVCFRKGIEDRREKREGMSSRAFPASHTPGVLTLFLSEES